ncbi:MAG: hypothetical protein HY714_01210 [Candidatus Omnitrophica bacterium]|nr:hypothetical protein [Candidatus Omnitrophota bacterium]
MKTLRNTGSAALLALGLAVFAGGTAEANHHLECCKYEGKKSLTQRELPEAQNEIVMMRVQQMERAQKEAGAAL